MEKNGMKEYRQPKVTVVNFKVERAIAGSQCECDILELDGICFD